MRKLRITGNWTSVNLNLFGEETFEALCKFELHFQERYLMHVYIQFTPSILVIELLVHPV